MPYPKEENNLLHTQKHTVTYDRNHDHPSVLFKWHAPEFEEIEKSGTWYLVFGILMISLIGYALVINSPIMAITFILSGIVGYIHLKKEPRIITFSISPKGIRASRQIYSFDSIKSFWIFYHPGFPKRLSIHTDASMFPYVHMPIRDEDPVKIREILLKYIDEVEQESSLIDNIERFFHI